LTADELRVAFAALPPLAAVTTWDQHRLALREHVKTSDAEDFLNWSTVSATMFVGEAPYIKKEWQSLSSRADFWENALQEPGIGNPPRLSYAPHTSGNLVHQAYHLQQWLDWSERDIRDIDSIYEVGAGYGTMALILHRLGFDGDYAVHDFVEVNLLRQWYLSQVDIESKKQTMEKPDLLIAACSLSEMHPSSRRLSPVETATSYLIVFQPRWNKVNNHSYFDELMDRRSDLFWAKYYSESYPNHWYLVGI